MEQGKFVYFRSMGVAVSHGHKERGHCLSRSRGQGEHNCIPAVLWEDFLNQGVLRFLESCGLGGRVPEGNHPGGWVLELWGAEGGVSNT